VVFAATVLALGAAVLHAGWNLAAKQSGDRFLALWGQFIVAGLVGWVALAVWWAASLGPAASIEPPDLAWGWAIASGVIHLPYLILLAAAYDRGDFSLAYPIARGGGAVLAALGGVLLLDDSLSVAAGVGISVTASGLAILGMSVGRSVGKGGGRSADGGGHRVPVLPVLGLPILVAVAIGTYTVVDSAGARASDDGVAYALAVFAWTGTTCGMWAVARGRVRHVANWMRAAPGRTVATGTAAMLTYAMVILAVQRAPVGYVAALRESSVVLAAFAGWRMLDEGDHRRRIASSVLVLIGLVILVAGA
jgi:uncharacterized membrane protein